MVPTSMILYHFSTLHILVVFFGEDTASNLSNESIKCMMFDIANEFMWMF